MSSKSQSDFKRAGAPAFPHSKTFGERTPRSTLCGEVCGRNLGRVGLPKSGISGGRGIPGNSLGSPNATSWGAGEIPGNSSGPHSAHLWGAGEFQGIRQIPNCRHLGGRGIPGEFLGAPIPIFQGAGEFGGIGFGGAVTLL